VKISQEERYPNFQTFGEREVLDMALFTTEK